jgi:serine/threonine-protein kinase
MEFLEGESLRECLARVKRMDQTAALDIVAQISRALEAAHTKGIVHRDLKPDNVFLVSSEASPGPPVVKVLDFGIAKLAAEGDDGHQRTKTGNLLGTPLYMSPEQCRGAGKVDLRADIYSLGCIAYELLTGSPPFVRDGAGELLVAHMMEQPKDLDTLVPGLAPGIASLVASMLEKDPARRPASMVEIAEKIERLTGIATPAFPVHVTGRQSMPGLAPASAPGLRPSPAVDTTLGRTAGEVIEPDVLPRARGRGLMIGGAVAAVAVVVGFLALRGSGKQDAPAGPVAATTAPPPAAPAAPVAAAAAPVAPAAVARPAPAPRPAVAVEITSMPPGAELWVDGEATSRGRTPLTVTLGADATPARAVVKSAGYADYRLSLDPHGEKKLTLKLEKAEKTDKPHARHASPKGAPSAGTIYRPMGD